MTNIPPPLTTPIRVDHGAVVVPKNYTFPQVCLFTGATEDLVPARKKLYWHNPWFYLLILLNLLIYAVVALCVRKVADVNFFISRAERTRRRRWHLLNWFLFLMTFVSLIVAGTMDLNFMFFASPIFLLSSIVIYFWKVRWLYPRRIDEQSVAICGIAPEVLQTLAS